MKIKALEESVQLNESSLGRLTYDKIPLNAKFKTIASGREMVVKVISDDGAINNTSPDGGGMSKEVFFQSKDAPHSLDALSVLLSDSGRTRKHYMVQVVNGISYNPSKGKTYLLTDDVFDAISVFNRVLKNVCQLVDLDDFDSTIDAIDDADFDF